MVLLNMGDMGKEIGNDIVSKQNERNVSIEDVGGQCGGNAFECSGTRINTMHDTFGTEKEGGKERKYSR